MPASKRLAERDGEVAEGALAFEITKAVTLDLLDDQITEAMGWRKQAGLVAEGDPTTASPESPVVVWVLRDDVEVNTVRKAVTAYQEVETPASATPDEFNLLREKIASGEDLSVAEMQAALRLLLTRGV